MFHFPFHTILHHWGIYYIGDLYSVYIYICIIPLFKPSVALPCCIMGIFWGPYGNILGFSKGHNEIMESGNYYLGFKGLGLEAAHL